MSEYIKNGDFKDRVLEPWDWIKNPGQLSGDGTREFALLGSGSELHQAMTVDDVKNLRFSLEIMVKAGASGVGQVQLVTLYQVGTSNPVLNAYYIREYPTWQPANIALDFGKENNVTVNIILLSVTGHEKEVSMTKISLSNVGSDKGINPDSYSKIVDNAVLDELKNKYIKNGKFNKG